MGTRFYDRLALTILIIGALNWGVIGFFRYDMLSMLFGGAWSMTSRVVYAIVGLAGLYALSIYGRIRERDAEYEGTRAV